VVRIRSLYLRPERIDERVLSGALEALERRFDPVRFERHGLRGELWVGEDRATFETGPDLEPEEFLSTLSRAQEYVRLRLGPDLDGELAKDETLELVALRGALGALDRHSTIFAGKSTEDFQIRFSGELQGIGSRIGRRDGELVAIRVFPQSPAERAGLQDGDAIVAIDGEPTRPMTVEEAVEKIRGPTDSVVTLSTRRKDQALEIRIKRGRVTVPSVEAELLSPGLGYARVFQVSRSTPAEFRRLVSTLGELRGLVLDLRSNTGGSMLAAAELADLFLEDGTILRTVGRDRAAVSGLRDRAEASKEVVFPFPVVVLVDEATASAAEILAGALAPLPRVSLVGQRTFGKGVVQRIYPLPERHLLKLTVAEYLLSEDRVIEENGVEPQLTLFPVPSERIAALAGVSEELVPYVRTSAEDDRFPVRVGEAILRDGMQAGLEAVRSESEGAIRSRLLELGVEWFGEPESLPFPLPRGLEIDARAPALEAGRSERIVVRVRNPNPFPIPDAWATLDGPVQELASKAFPLGTLPAEGETSFEAEGSLGLGLTARELPITVHVASRLRPLASQRVVLQAREHVPDLEIEIAREGDLARIGLRNVGDIDAGELRVETEGAFRVVEALPAGAQETVELPLAGPAKSATILLAGPLAQRRIQVPMPESSLRVVPPRLRVSAGGWPGFRRIRLETSDPTELREGWIALDGDKKAYASWAGKRSGRLSVRPSKEEHTVLAKVETASGVEVLDQRTLRAD
jgi:carboxyl-terminal processing protease